jgi:serine/threonine-protein kinase
MTTEAFHPDRLLPGEKVGPWLIRELLGSGGFGRVFKVERDGQVYALKMALRPVSASPSLLTEDGTARMRHETAALLISGEESGLARVYAMDAWPEPRSGYLFFVTDFVEGVPFLKWCREERPSADQLVEVFSKLVRAVGELHQRGLYHRDLTSSNVLVHGENDSVTLVDFGAVRLPGAAQLTLGLPPGAFHVLSPEAVDFARREQWKQGERFEGGAPAELYALGVLLYEVLAGRPPFPVDVNDDELLAAIEHAVPRAPHRLNPWAPRPLSEVAMRLLEKQPAARYESAEALLKALSEASGERESPPWQAPLEWPTGEPPAVGPEEKRERRAREQAAARRAREARREQEAREQGTPPLGAWWARRRSLLAMLAVLLVGLAVGRWSATLASLHAAALAQPASTQRGAPPMLSFPPEQEPTLGQSLRAWLLCAFAATGCAAPRVNPPYLLSECPEEAQRAMVETLKLKKDRYPSFFVVIDTTQPGGWQDIAILREGPVVGRVVHDAPPPTRLPGIPPGTLLYGRIWLNKALEDGRPVIMLRYDRARLPDDGPGMPYKGQEVPVCFNMGGPEGRWVSVPDWPEDSPPPPGTIYRPNIAQLTPVWRWP